MHTRPEKKDARKCCCCIPIRAGAMMLTILYFLGGLAVVAAAVLILINGSLKLTTAANGIVVALGILGLLLAVTSAIGFASTITLNPSGASTFANMFTFWLFLEFVLDIAILVMFFTRALDSMIPICSSASSRGTGTWREASERDCRVTRKRMSWYWVVGMIIRSFIGYYFMRRMSSFSRYCAERAEPQHSHTSSTPMAPVSTFVPVNRNAQPVAGTMFASNFSAPGGYESRPRQPHNGSTPAPQQVGFPAHNQNLSPQGGYPQAYQASADSLQSTAKVEEAPAYYNTTAEKAV
ncbi:hypothetical protein BDV93DRAFT_506584 [Ceratobasidium sp. AG-I]|nr:hypothetical protein BDV93DRAFT_506584 [Ceratobasidium sp. AG-I]